MASAVVNSRKALAAQPAYVSNNFQMNSSEVRAEVRLSVETKESFAAYVTGISSVNCRINCTQDTLSSSHAWPSKRASEGILHTTELVSFILSTQATKHVLIHSKASKT